MKEKDDTLMLRKITIKIEKKANYYYDAEKKLLVKLNKETKSKYYDKSNFQFNLQIILPHRDLNKDYLIKKGLEYLKPLKVIQKVLELKKEYPNASLKKMIDDTEYSMIKQISSTLLGSDDNPARIYEYLSDILLQISKQLETEYNEFNHLLAEELKKRGLLDI